MSTAARKDRSAFERRFRCRSFSPGAISYQDIVNAGKASQERGTPSLAVELPTPPSSSSNSTTHHSTTSNSTAVTSAAAIPSTGTSSLSQPNSSSNRGFVVPSVSFTSSTDQSAATHHKRRLSLFSGLRKGPSKAPSGADSNLWLDGNIPEKPIPPPLPVSASPKRHSIHLLTHAYDSDQTTLRPLSSPKTRSSLRQSSDKQSLPPPPNQPAPQPGTEELTQEVSSIDYTTTTATTTTTSSSQLNIATTILDPSISTAPSMSSPTLTAKILNRSDVDKKYSSMGADFFEIEPTCFGSKDFSIENESRPPLHRAVFLGVDAVRSELEKSANIHARYIVDNSTALHAAVINGDVAVLRLLLEAGASQDAQDKSNNTPLHLGTHNSNVEAVRILLEDCPKAVLNTRNVDGNTPLHVAVMMRNSQITGMLMTLRDKPDSNVYNVAGYVPLHLAVLNNDLKTVEILLKAGADPNSRGPLQETALHQAVLGHVEKPEFVSLLLQNKADPGLSDGAGNIPLYYALVKKREATISTFVKENPTDMCYVYDFKLQILRETHPERLLPKHFDVPIKPSKNAIKWEKMMSDWEKAKKPKVRKACLKGVPASVRPVVWLLLSRSSSLRAKNASTYSLLLNASPPTPVLTQIDADVKRAVLLQHFHDVDHEALQLSLFKLLRVYAVHDPSLGYRQGMAEIAAFLLLHLDEENSFWTFVQLMSDENYSLRNVFLEGNTALQKFFATQKQLLSQDTPHVWAHFKARAVESRLQMYLTEWFITLYLRVLPYDIVAGVFDLLFYEGYEVLYAVTVAIFYTFRKEILAVNDDGLLVNKVRDIHLLFDSCQISTEEFLTNTTKFLHSRKELPTFSPTKLPSTTTPGTPLRMSQCTSPPPRKDSS
ncbi:blast:TBC1 domain family member 10A [Pelomyxa schiedti]|nr:blast:TBC1 domain family member 10A [Pelomyxa schiedti]